MPPEDAEFRPRDFFEALLPGLVADRSVRAVGDVVQWYLMGEAEDLAYVCDLRVDPGRVYPGEFQEAAVRVAIDESCVVPLLAGELDVARAVADEQLQVEGDLEVLRRFGEVFADGITGMGLLYASVNR